MESYRWSICSCTLQLLFSFFCRQEVFSLDSIWNSIRNKTIDGGKADIYETLSISFEDLILFFYFDDTGFIKFEPFSWITLENSNNHEVPYHILNAFA